MDLLTITRLRRDPELRDRIEGACLILNVRYDDDAVRKVILDPDVQSGFSTQPPSASATTDEAIIAALQA